VRLAIGRCRTRATARIVRPHDHGAAGGVRAARGYGGSGVLGFLSGGGLGGELGLE
jgi:hypothetical protein